MKKIILSLLFFHMTLTSANAGIVWPTVFNLGNYLQVQAHNNTDRPVWCSGNVFMTMMSGKTESSFYSDYIHSGGFSIRYIYPISRDRIRFHNHSIFCN